MTWTPLDPQPVTLSLGGTAVTGFYEITDLESEYEWQIAKPKGTTGSNSKYLGRRDRKFTIKVTLTTVDEYENWVNIVASVLKAPDKGKPYVIAIDHPMLAEHYAITHCRLVREVAPMRERQGLRRWFASLHLEESAPPKTTSVAVKGASTPPKDPALNSPRAAELEKVREDNAQLSAQDQQLSQQLYTNDADSLAAGIIPP